MSLSLCFITKQKLLITLNLISCPLNPPPPAFKPPHPPNPHHRCLPDEWLWSAKHARLTLNCENNAPVVVLTFPMLPHLNRPGYGFHRFQGKTHFQSKQRSQPSLGSCRDSRHAHGTLTYFSVFTYITYDEWFYSV